MADYNKQIIEAFRANKGKVGGMFGSMELLLLHSVGAKTGNVSVKPVAYTKDGDNFVIVASYGGSPTNPAWYYNLRAHPEVVIEVGAEKFSVKATLAEGKERDRLFSQHAAQYPNFNEYRSKTTRVLPVFTLERI